MSPGPARQRRSPDAADFRDPASYRVGADGITLPALSRTKFQLLFDERPVITLMPDVMPLERVVHEPWPGEMRQYLDGRSRMRVRVRGHEVDLGEVSFGSGEGRVEFVDGFGIPVVIDKWGLAQRTFANRGAEVSEFMAEFAERIIDVVRDATGIELWLAFGTLLGAARGGGVIPHDSDIDLAFYSEEQSPARMALQLFSIRRALTDAGIRAIIKAGSFLTVLFEAPDGAPASIDVYTTFHFHGLLYETATVRDGSVPREAILPLGRMRFEGRMMPVPADVDTMLAASYGPGWRSPDPGFSHTPGPEHNSRFDGWFGNLMRQRREWEVAHRRARPDHDNGSDFRRWVAARVEARATIFDVGIGHGDDAVAFAREGHAVRGVDYSREAGAAVRAVREEFDLEQLLWRQFNLYDLRDVMTLGSLWGRQHGGPDGAQRVVYGRNIVDAISTEFSENLPTFTRLLAPGPRDRVFLEFEEVQQHGEDPVRFHPDSGRQYAVRADVVRRQWEAAGARVLEEARWSLPRRDQPTRTRCRMVLTWQ